MKPTASDEDPAWVYFTADSSGYPFTYRIKSNGTGLEKLYGSKAGPIWISPDNKKVYIASQVPFPGDPIDTFCPKGITIWDIEKRKKTVLPFYDESTWGSGWYDNDNILYAKYYYSTKRLSCLFKQNVHTGDTSIIFHWDKSAKPRPNAVYNKKDNSFYYIDDSLYVFKGKNRMYQSYPVEYHYEQPNLGTVTLSMGSDALLFYNFNDKKNEHENVLTDLKGKTILVIDESKVPEGNIAYRRIDMNGLWVYFFGSQDVNGTLHCYIKRKSLTAVDKTETIFLTKTDRFSIGYLALGYDQ